MCLRSPHLGKKLASFGGGWVEYLGLDGKVAMMAAAFGVAEEREVDDS